MGIYLVITSIVSDIIHIAICIVFTCIMLERKASFYKMIILYIVGYMFLSLVGIFVKGITELILLFYLLFGYFYMFKGKIIHKIFTYMVISSVNYSTELLVITIENFESQQNIFKMSIGDNSSELFIAITKIIIYSVIIIVLKCSNSFKNLKISTFPSSKTLLMTVLPLFGECTVIIMDISIRELEIVPIKANILMLIASMSTILYISTLLIMIDKMVLNKQLLYNVQLSKAQLDVQFEHYKSLVENTKHTKRLKHDMKNHIMCIKNLIEQDKLDEVKSFIGEINNLLNSDKNIISTGNTIVDAIVNDKAIIAQSRDIKFEFSGCLPSDNFISPFDISTIFCNAIDNAIEASGKSDAPFVKIEVFSQGDCLIINISNSVNKNISVAGNTIATTKSNSSEHGLGLLNIKESVEKNKGELSLRCKNEIFTLDILFRSISLH